LFFAFRTSSQCDDVATELAERNAALAVADAPVARQMVNEEKDAIKVNAIVPTLYRARRMSPILF
jgi:hypothetical protein